MHGLHVDSLHVHVAYQHDRFHAEVARDRLADQARAARPPTVIRRWDWLAILVAALGLVAGAAASR
ncbi:MAG: hypothetical protein IT340_15940 [Chloroflexi bacterium]|nr:hypothetical protein [Chloroflexota bacterium]